MGRLPGINHLLAVKALERAGFVIIRQSGHIVMSDGRRILTIPPHNPVNAFTMFAIVMFAIVRDAGFTIEQFRELL